MNVTEYWKLNQADYYWYGRFVMVGRLVSAQFGGVYTEVITKMSHAEPILCVI